MEQDVRLISHWLNRKINPNALLITAITIFSVCALAFAYYGGYFNTRDWMAASKQTALVDKQYWRLWTTLFAHGDFGHLIANMMLFAPLTLLLNGYFGSWLFPIQGLAIGGLINLAVLQTMSLQTKLIGISGVVNWMGAAWLTLYLLIDRRYTLRRQFGVAVFLTVMLFVPQSYEPDISYLSHGIGFALGILSGITHYVWHRTEFKAAEVYQIIPNEEPEEILP